MGNEDYLIKNVSLFDTSNGDISVSDLAIKNGRVTSPDLLKDPKIKDGTGLITMFGIWDCHSHPGSLMYDNFAHGYFESAAARTIRAGSNLIEAARLGITGVRALSEANQIDIEWGKTFKDIYDLTIKNIKKNKRINVNVLFSNYRQLNMIIYIR